jgi:restriction system protein
VIQYLRAINCRLEVVTGVAVPIPDFQTIMKPLLQVASDGKQHSNREAREVLANTFKLSDEDKNALLPSGRQGVFVNRVAWAKAYLRKQASWKHRKEDTSELLSAADKH